MVAELVYPIREGEQAQTAFAFGLILDYSRGTDAALGSMVTAKVKQFYLKDRDCPIDYEPSGQDFLSPCIAEADVMRRVLPPAEFAPWLTKFLPRIPPGNQANGYLLESSSTRQMASSRTWTASTSVVRGCSRESRLACRPTIIAFAH